VIGFFILILGSMLRFESFYIAASFGMVLLFNSIWKTRNELKDIKRKAVFCGFAAFIVLLFEFVGNSMWNASLEGKEYREYDKLRRSVMLASG